MRATNFGTGGFANSIGPFITEAVQLLDDVLTRILAHQQKKTAQLRALHSWQSLFEG
jgi:hypothetical protein